MKKDIYSMTEKELQKYQSDINRINTNNNKKLLSAIQKLKHENYCKNFSLLKCSDQFLSGLKNAIYNFCNLKNNYFIKIVILDKTIKVIILKNPHLKKTDSEFTDFSYAKFSDYELTNCIESFFNSMDFDIYEKRIKDIAYTNIYEYTLINWDN